MTARRRPIRKTGERGGALLIVLWLSAALAAIGVSVATTVRTEVDHTSTMADGLRTQYLASGSVDRFLQWMAWGDVRNPDGTPRFWQRRQTLYSMNYSSGVAVVQTIPETAKLNVNRATADDLLAVITILSGDSGRAVVARTRWTPFIPPWARLSSPGMRPWKRLRNFCLCAG
jgi:general secretion pathway protein K